jgi:hypothetical protein
VATNRKQHFEAIQTVRNENTTRMKGQRITEDHLTSFNRWLYIASFMQLLGGFLQLLGGLLQLSVATVTGFLVTSVFAGVSLAALSSFHCILEQHLDEKHRMYHRSHFAILLMAIFVIPVGLVLGILLITLGRNPISTTINGVSSNLSLKEKKTD